MAQFFEIHPDNPQRRLIQQAVSIIDAGGLVIYPTDSSYALGCHIGDKAPASPEKDEATPADLIPGLMKRIGLDSSLWLQELEAEWGTLVGEALSKHTRPGRVDQGRLTVFVDSSVWLNELARYGQKELVDKLQERFGRAKIRKVTFSLDPD